MKDTTFQIYNASAGSGKTFTLVREYLSILLGTGNKDRFKQVLAITFTNKAVNEMKERVLQSLEEFADPELLASPSPLFKQVQEQLGLSPEEIQQRAGTLLHYILHNYAFFDIVTIDKFTHRLIRTFAKDLELPQNFEVVMDTEGLLREAIDDLLYKAGEEETLTKALIQFATEKADDDKHWDLSRDLFNTSRLLLTENDKPYVEELRKKSMQDLLGILGKIRKESAALKTQLRELAIAKLEQIAEAGLEHKDFTRGSLPKFLQQVHEGNTSMKMDAQWFGKIDTDPLYSKNTKGCKATMDALQPDLSEAIKTLMAGIHRYRFLQAIYKNLVPMSLINAVNGEMKRIEKEQQLLPISAFNNMISEAIREQPAPFIYERLGERYKNYFIDEFQDTSALQWNNLLPLISNALSGESLTGQRGSLMIVGDAKQSIYRWRGGKAEQFIDLYSDDEHNPFPVSKTTANLETNHRSFDEVIHFNNDFFHFISRFIENPEYSALFAEQSKQETTGRSGGYVEFHFTPKEAEDKDLEQLQHCRKTIESLKAQGYRPGDIAILNRNNKSALKVAQHLTDNGIPVISSESLLLKNDPKVKFLASLIRFAYREEDRENLLDLLWFLSDHRGEEDMHAFLSEHLDQPDTLFETYNFSADRFREMPFYNALEYALECFDLCRGDEAYLQAFLDTVLDFTQKESGSLGDFIEYWESRKDKLSLSAPDHADAVQILTIHKSKGLQFPVVIYPFADANIYHEVDPKLWIPLENNPWDLPYALLNKNDQLNHFGPEASAALETYKHHQELDSFNVLYVAFTRAVERLYVICEEKINSKGEQLNTLPGVFINYLKEKGRWLPEEKTYTFGDPKKNYHPKETKEKTDPGIPFISNKGLLDTYTIVTRSGNLWGTEAEASIAKGHLYHDLLSRIRYGHELDDILEEAMLRGDVSDKQQEGTRRYLMQVTEHPELSEFFKSSYAIHNEKELMTGTGKILRPDRFMTRDGKAWIIDYKTGEPHPKYHQQLEDYARALREIGYKVVDKMLVYIGEEIRVEHPS